MYERASSFDDFLIYTTTNGNWKGRGDLKRKNSERYQSTNAFHVL